MDELTPFRFVAKVYPTEDHPQTDIIGWTFAHAIVFDGSLFNAKARLWMYLEAHHWEVEDIEVADAMPLSQIVEGGTAESALYHRAAQQGFAVDFHANPKGKPDPGSLLD